MAIDNLWKAIIIGFSWVVFGFHQGLVSDYSNASSFTALLFLKAWGFMKQQWSISIPMCQTSAPCGD